MQIDEDYYQSEEFREMLENYEASVSEGTHPFMDADDLVDIADYYNASDDLERAEEVIDYALQLYPHSALPNVFKAREALMDGDSQLARSYADNIEERDAPDYHYLLAEILIAEGRIEEADQYLRDYGQTVDNDEYEDFVKDCANLYIDYNVSDKAYEWMMRSRGDDSDDFKELMARTLFGLGKYKDSERLFNELIDHNPYSKHYWNALASAQFMNEDYSSAITSSEYAIAIDPTDPEGILSKANGLLRLNNYEEALTYYQRYSNLIPDDEFGMLHQGVCLLNMGRKDEALAVLTAALETAPDDSPYLVQILQETAFCLSAMKRPKEAIDMLDRTEEMDCDHIDMKVIRGHILLENGLVAEAEDIFKQAIVQSGNAPGVLLRIIVSLYDNHYVKAAYEMMLKFFNYVEAYAPDFKEGHAYMALCCYDLGRTSEFMHHLRLAVEDSPQEAQLVLGCLFPEGMPAKEYYEYMTHRLSKS